MEHPFMTNKEISQQQSNDVVGGVSVTLREIRAEALGPTPYVKPEIGSTMAIGEEGGSFGVWF